MDIRLHETQPATAPARLRSQITPGRILLALLLPLAPALVAALRGVLPYFSADSSLEVAQSVAANLGAQNAVVWLGFAATLTLPVAAVLAGRIVYAGAPRMTMAAEILLVPGYLAMSSLVAGDAALYFGAKNDLDPSVVAKMYDELHPTVMVGIGIFVVGHVLGTVLLGIAAIRSRVLPMWAGVALAGCQPLHFFALVIIGNQPLDVIAWSLNSVVFGMLALVWLRGDRPVFPGTSGAERFR